MNQQHNSYVELPRIKRKSNSWEGKVIDYLLNHPSNRPATEFSMSAITAFWVAEALQGKVSHEELQSACWSAIEHLEAKLATIRRIGGIEKLPNNYSLSLGTTAAAMTADNNPPINSSVHQEEQPQNMDDDDDDDDSIMTMKLSEEMVEANKFFGVIGS